jgi:hypothetical protein
MSRLRSVFCRTRREELGLKSMKRRREQFFRAGCGKVAHPGGCQPSQTMGLPESAGGGSGSSPLEELSSALLESISCREVGLSTIQEHMEVLISHLHQRQETDDRQVILVGLEAPIF